jgi:hypothetical protein
LAFEGEIFLGRGVGAMGGGEEFAAEGEACGIGFESYVAEFEFMKGPTLLME